MDSRSHNYVNKLGSQTRMSVNKLGSQTRMSVNKLGSQARMSAPRPVGIYDDDEEYHPSMPLGFSRMRPSIQQKRFIDRDSESDIDDYLSDLEEEPNKRPATSRPKKIKVSETSKAEDGSKNTVPNCKAEDGSKNTVPNCKAEDDNKNIVPNSKTQTVIDTRILLERNNEDSRCCDEMAWDGTCHIHNPPTALMQSQFEDPPRTETPRKFVGFPPHVVELIHDHLDEIRRTECAYNNCHSDWRDCDYNCSRLNHHLKQHETPSDEWYLEDYTGSINEAVARGNVSNAVARRADILNYVNRSIRPHGHFMGITNHRELLHLDDIVFLRNIITSLSNDRLFKELERHSFQGLRSYILSHFDVGQEGKLTSYSWSEQFYRVVDEIIDLHDKEVFLNDDKYEYLADVGFTCYHPYGNFCDGYCYRFAIELARYRIGKTYKFNIERDVRNCLQLPDFKVHRKHKDIMDIIRTNLANGIYSGDYNNMITNLFRGGDHKSCIRLHRDFFRNVQMQSWYSEAKETIGKTNKVMETLLGFFETIKTTLGSALDKISSDGRSAFDSLFYDLSSLLAIAYDVFVCGRDFSVQTLALIMHICVNHGLHTSMVKSAWDKLCGAGVKMQSQSTDALGSFFTFVVASMTVGSSAKKDLLSRFNPGEFAKSWNVFKGFDSSSRGFSQFLDLVFRYAKSIGCITLRTMGYEIAYDEQVDDIVDWYNFVDKIASNPNYSIEIETNEQLALDVIDKFSFGMKLGKLLPNDEKVKYNQHMRLLVAKYLEAVRSPVFQNQMRKEPFCIYIHGQPGVGKSNIVKILETLLCKTYLDDLKADGKEEPSWAKAFNDGDTSRIRFSKSAGSDYYEGYANQPVYLLDDFLQEADTAGNPNLQPLEVIQAVNVAPFPLNMAAVERKSTTFFKSQFVIITSNVSPNRDFHALADSDAFKRRLHVRAEVCVPDAYYDSVTKAVNTSLVCKSVEKGVHKSILDIVRFHVPNPSGVGAALMTCTEFCKHIVSVYKERKIRSQILDSTFDDIVGNIIKGMDIDASLTTPKEVPRPVTPPTPEPPFDYTKKTLETSEANMEMWTSYWGTSVQEATEVGEDVAATEPNAISYIANRTGSSKFMRLLEILYSHKELLLGVGSIAGLTWWFTRPKKITEFYAEYEDCKCEGPCIHLGTDNTDRLIVENKYGSNQVGFTIVGGMPTKPYYDKDLCHRNSQWSVFDPRDCVKRAIFIVGASGKTIRDGTYGITFDVRFSDPLLMAVEALLHFTIHDPGRHEYVDISDKVIKKGAPIKFDSIYPQVSLEMTHKGSDVESHPQDDERRWNGKNKKFKVEMQGQVNRNYTLMQSICRQNIRAVIGEKSGKTEYTVRFSILMLHSNIGVIPAHCKSAFVSGQTIKWIDETKDYTVEVNTSTINVHQPDEDRDICFVEFTERSTCPPAKDILSHFVTDSEFVNLSVFEGCLASAKARGNDKSMYMTPSYQTSEMRIMRAEKRMVDNRGAKRCFYYGSLVSYPTNTMDGDCGSPCWATGLAGGQTIGRPKLLGFHTLGLAPVGNEARNCSQVFTQETLRKYMSVIKFQPQSAFVSNAVDIVDPSPAYQQGNFTEIGVVNDKNPSVYVNRTTAFKPSPLIGLFPVTKVPAALKKFENETGVVDPMEYGLKKAGGRVKPIDKILATRCIEEVFSTLERDYQPHKLNFPLSIHDAINDVDTFNVYGKIERGTSMGYPLSQTTKKTTKKNYLLGTGEEWIYDHPELISRCERFCELAQQRIVDNVIFTDTLKDELRPVEKVKEGKTRVVSAGPVAFTVVFRRYFLPFTTSIHNSRIENEIAVGINVYDPNEWSRLRKWLSVYHDGAVFAGDFTNYDGTLNPDILEMIFEKIIEICQPSEYDSNVMRALYKAITEAVHINGALVYQWTHGQPSGCPITSVINSIYNSVTARMCYYMVNPNFPEFGRHIRMISYGDDNVFHVPADLANDEFVGQFCSNYEALGMKYTGTSKQGMPVLTDIENVDFLKRKFRTVEYGGCEYSVAPLDLESITSMLQYNTNKADPVKMMEQKIDTAMEELVFHGKDVFEKYRDIIKSGAVQNGYRVTFYSYFAQLEKWLAQYGKLVYSDAHKVLFEGVRMQSAEDTVEFVDDTPTNTGEDEHVHVDTKVGKESGPTRDIITFLERPESLKSIPITISPAKQILANYSIPEDVLPIMKRDKLLGFKNVKFDVKLTIKPSTNPYISGRIILFFYSQNKFNDSDGGNGPYFPFTSGQSVYSLTSATGCPSVEIDLSSGESVDIILPYISSFSHWDQTTVDPSNDHHTHLPSIYKFVVATYSPIWTDGPCSLQVFASLCNIDLSFAAYPTRLLSGSQTVASQMLVDSGMDKDSADKYIAKNPVAPIYPRVHMQGLVADVVDTTKNVTNIVGPMVSAVPLVGTAVGAVGSVMNFLSSLGLSKPLHVADTTPVASILGKFSQNIDGTDDSRVFGLSSTNHLVEDGGNLGSEVDEMAFSSFFGKWEYITTMEWESSTSAGTMLGRIQVNPCLHDLDIGVAPSGLINASVGPPSVCVVPTHLGFVSQFFNYWRGTLKYKFKFVKTAFHVGRVRIMWMPGEQSDTYDPAVTYDNNNPEASYFHQKIVDLRDTTDVDFEIPFASNRPFNLVGTIPLNTFPDYYCNGHIVVQALSTLSAASGVSPKVPIIVEACGGSDLEFAMYKGNPWSLPYQTPTTPSENFFVRNVQGFMPVKTGKAQSETYGGIGTYNAPATVQEGVQKVVVVNGGSTVPDPEKNPLPISLMMPTMDRLNGDFITRHQEGANWTYVSSTNPLVTRTVCPPVPDFTNIGCLRTGIVEDGQVNIQLHDARITTPQTVVELCPTLNDGEHTTGTPDWLPHNLRNPKPVIAVRPADDSISYDSVLPTECTWTMEQVDVLPELKTSSMPDRDMHVRKNNGIWRLAVANSTVDATAEDTEVRMQGALNPSKSVNLTAAYSDKVIPDSTTTGESIQSFRALLKIFSLNASVVDEVTTIKGRPSTGFVLYPQSQVPMYGYYLTSSNQLENPATTGMGLQPGVNTYSLHSPDLIDILSTMFGYWKGSVRTKVVNMGGGDATTEVFQNSSDGMARWCVPSMSSVFPIAGLRSNNLPVAGVPVTAAETMVLADPSTHQIFVGNDVEARNVQIQHPYYHPLLMSKCGTEVLCSGESFYSASSKLWHMPQLLTTYVYSGLRPDEGGHQRRTVHKVYRAGGDDFSFHFLQGCPVLALQLASTPGGSSTRNTLYTYGDHA